ncbi:hypothetical protein M9Y10_003573 [Tritrichomonas musculus]|uniref:Uncharacterized protein n=1 Tax=Tritrichomonas musculus TaxID=1915356 RepID=A0ABR2JPS3_9EUKA
MDDKITSIRKELHEAVELGYLSVEQLNLFEACLISHLTYSQLSDLFRISGRTPLSHALQRTAALEYWSCGIGATGSTYLSQYDENLFIGVKKSSDPPPLFFDTCLPKIWFYSIFR